MNLNSPERLKALVKEHQWSGGTLYLRKMTVLQWRDISKARKDYVSDETDEIGGFRWAALALSKQVCDESGALTCDSDDGREQFLGLSPEELQSLLLAAHEWSGVWRPQEEQKKS